MFTSITLNKTIEITLERAYDRKEVSTDIPKTITKEMLLLCTKDVHFFFEDEIYQQTVGVAMVSPLGPIIGGIFMVEIETTIVPTLGNSHMNIKFTHVAESNNMLPFLDVFAID